MSVLLCLGECACFVERTSNMAYVLELFGDLVLMMASWYAPYLLLLCKLSPTAWSSMWLQDHLLSAAGSPDTPNAPPSALTTVFACSRAWSIIIGENFRLDLCTITFQFRSPEPSEVVSVKPHCLCREQEYIVHLHCFGQNRMVSARSVTDSTD